MTGGFCQTARYHPAAYCFKISNGKYQLIAGERRFRAAKIAGLTDIPAYIRRANDQQLLELALLRIYNGGASMPSK